MLKVEKLFNKLLEIQERDKKVDKAFKWFIESVSPDMVPFIEFNGLIGYLKAIKIFNESLEEDFSRFLYEITIDNKHTRPLEIDGKIYKIKTQKDYLNFLKDYYKDL